MQMVVESNLLVSVLDHGLLLTLWWGRQGWIWVKVSCSLILLTFWTFCRWFHFNFWVKLFTLEELLRLGLLRRRLLTNLVSFLILVLSITHVSNGVALIGSCCGSHRGVLLYQSFWWRHHLLESLIRKVRFILFGSVLESKLLLGLGDFACLVW